MTRDYITQFVPKKREENRCNMCIQLYEVLIAFEVLGILYHIHLKLFFSWDGGKQL